MTTAEFIEKAKAVHGDKYIYDKVEYKNNTTKVEIICPKHGSFWQAPVSHLQGIGCPKCGIERNKAANSHTTSEFIEKAKAVHGDKYDYSKVEYKNNITKVEIICPIHGSFWQSPGNHLCDHGCPKCNQSILETMVARALETQNIQYIPQYSPGWLGRQSLDFYLPQHNIAIECQGEQHYKSVDIFKGDRGFEEQQYRDEKKRELCKENGVKLIEISYMQSQKKIKETIHQLTQTSFLD